jgi:2-oxoglutarate dehydrogenase E2 component (dihydrolipoamide succinyltransferase)
MDIKVPEFGDSIQEVQIAQWLKREGEWVDKDEDLVELESEKAAQALPSPEAGVVEKILMDDGSFANIGDVIAKLNTSAKSSGSKSSQAEKPEQKSGASEQRSEKKAQAGGNGEDQAEGSVATMVMPAAERMLHEYKISAEQISATGPGGRLLKEDVINYIDKHNLRPGSDDKADKESGKSKSAPAKKSEATDWNQTVESRGAQRQETVKPMSMIRRTIAKHLVNAQQTAALLTTFNEIDMQPVMQLRSTYKEQFQKKHGVKLGFMSFFAKASVEALKRCPEINAEIRGNDIVYRNYYDIGVAIGGGKGLLVPVLRSVERLSFADIERQIGAYAELAQDNKVKPADLEGGTFTISNGGIYGSLLSTPIINPPQSGILGLHSIQERPIARNGEVIIRPMMYVALTYDHRIVDGKDAVGFLRTIKEVLEEPARLFLEV